MYIFKHYIKPLRGPRTARFVTAPDFVAYESEINVPTGKTIAGFTEVRGTGRMDKTIVSIRSAGEPSLSGHGTKREWRQTIRRTAPDVKKNVRKVRPEEEALLAQHDLVIAELEEALKTARIARAEAVADAWERAHVVRLQEVEEKVAKKP